MKILVSSVIGLIALFTVTAGFNIHARFSNAHWVVDPCISGQTIQGRIAGLGQGDLTIVITGQVACQNPGSQDPPAWQNLTREIHAQVTKNGSYTLNYNVNACKKNWTTILQNIDIAVYEGATATGTPVLTANDIPTCQ